MDQSKNAPSAVISQPLAEQVQAFVESLHLDQDSNLIGVLQQTQDEFGYLPAPALAQISQLAKIPLSRIYGVVSFYAQFYTEPRGRHMIRCCRGTACHVRGGKKLIESTEQILGIADGQTTDDMLFTLETVACLGACALAPVVTVDGKYHGKVTVAKMRKIVDACVEQAHQ